MEHYRAITHSDVSGISEGAQRCLLAYPWPGNIRELANAVERAVIVGTAAQIQARNLPPPVQQHSPESGVDSLMPSDWPDLEWRELRQRILDEAEHRYLTEVLRASSVGIRTAAERAGMATRSFTEKMRKHGLRKEDFRARAQRRTERI